MTWPRLYRFENKRLRSEAVKDYMVQHGYDRAVCFSCGNASRELKAAGVDVLDISPRGDMVALRWFSIGEVRDKFPDRFDATSGHLPMDCMQMVAERFKAELGELTGEIALPTGSGETLVCMKLAYPELRVTAVYDLDDATEYSPDAPLNGLVELLAEGILHGGGNDVSPD